MQDLASYWGVVVSLLTAGSSAVLYLIKNWRDVEALKQLQRLQATHIANLLERLDNIQTAVVEREIQQKQNLELLLRDQRTELIREIVAVRREGSVNALRLNERVDVLDKLLAVSVERQNQLLDITRRQEAHNERVDKILWQRANTRLSKE